MQEARFALPMNRGSAFRRKGRRANVGVPRHLWLLFMVGATYVVLPLFEIPLLGVSLSAPIFYVIAGEVMLGRAQVDRRAMRRWQPLLLVFGSSLAFSFVVSSAIRPEASLGLSEYILVVRYLYWIVVMFAVGAIIANLREPSVVVVWLGSALYVLAVVWMSGKLMTNAEFLTQNSYGFVFSTFWPFAFLTPLMLHGWRRYVTAILLVVTAAVVVLNNSRGSWVAISVETFLVIMLLVRSRYLRLKFGLLLGFLVAGLGTSLAFMPAGTLHPVVEKAESFRQLDQDKSFLVRRVMVQKGWRLFLENPIVGVGPGRFTRSMAEVQLPSRLRYYSSERINARSAHNSYIALLAETGLMGTLTYAVLMLALLWRSFKAAWRLMLVRQPWGLAIAAGLTGMSVHMWVISGLTGTITWMMYGLAAGMVAWVDRSPPSMQRALHDRVWGNR